MAGHWRTRAINLFSLLVNTTSYVIAPSAALVLSLRHTIENSGLSERPLRVIVFSQSGLLVSLALQCCSCSRSRPPSMEPVTYEAFTRSDSQNTPIYGVVCRA